MPGRQWNWAKLPQNLLTSIGERLPLDGRICYRAVCTSWRSALMPVSPCLILLNAANSTTSCIAFSLPANKLFHLPGHLPSALGSNHIVGANGAWLSITSVWTSLSKARTSFLLNILTGTRIILPPFPSSWQPQSIVKTAFYPNPKNNDYVVMTVGTYDKVAAYIKAGDECWTVLGTTMAISNFFMDVAHHDGKFYCLTRSGGVQVLDPTGTKQLVKFENYLQDETLTCHAFTPGYSPIHSANIAFCDNKPYQIWIVLQDGTTGPDIFFMVVMRYDNAENPPCWKLATDLQGYSVFLGMNNALSVRADDRVSGLRGNCVYYFNKFFDVGTGKLVQCLPPAATGQSYYPWSLISWY